LNKLLSIIEEEKKEVLLWNIVLFVQRSFYGMNEKSIVVGELNDIF
jgi:hypothetical protein